MYPAPHSLRRCADHQRNRHHWFNWLQCSRGNAWAAQVRERARAADKLRSDLLMAGRNLAIIRSSTVEVTAPWLLKEMAPRIASTLNYFLLHLTGRGAFS